MNNISDINYSKNIKFAEKHIGGSQDDSINTFNNQNNIILNSENNYERIIDYNNKTERDKNKNNKYVEQLNIEQQNSSYRINNYATYVDDINYSNPVIYPKNYDMHFDYLNKKNINPINTQIVKTKNYINIDSANRNINTNIDIKKYINLVDNSLEFTNQSNILKIYLNNADEYFKENNNLILRGFKNYETYYENLNFFFNDSSPTVIIDIKPNFIDVISYYDIFIKISEVTNGDNLFWKNIPLNLINNLHKIYKINSDNNYRIAFDLPILFYSENNSDKILISNCSIIYFNLGNYPINLINSNIPLTYNNLNTYLIINEVTSNYLTVNLKNIISLNDNIILDGYWDENKFRTGKGIQIGMIDNFIEGYPNSNNFVIDLGETYNNICSIKMISSEIPNVLKNININEKIINSYNGDVKLTNIQSSNNKFYWQNIIDFTTYEISLEPGYYSYIMLKNTIEDKVSKVKRNILLNFNNLYEYNTINVEFNETTNISTFNLFDIFILPNCFDGIIEILNSNDVIIRINQKQHNLKKGNKIFITGSIDYYYISKNYINSLDGHIITNVINNNFYEIRINNINKIIDVDNTKGGYGIKIKTFAIFRLLFNYSDTFGSIMGFSLVGYEYSITNYANIENNYTINNIEPYYFDIKKLIYINNNIPFGELYNGYLIQNISYILLLAENLNKNYNPNGPSYFYKILLNGQQNSILFNTFVPSPIYFNPPIKSLNNFKFTFILPNGKLVNFNNLNLSFTLEISTLNNLPENTNITTYMSRM